MIGRRLRWMATLAALHLDACASAPSTPASPTSTTAPTTTPIEPSNRADADHWSNAVAAGDPIPVTDADPIEGAPAAPVTIVVFGDVIHPSCAREMQRLDSLRAVYGPEKLRIAWKQFPATAAGARGAAALGAGIFDLGGSTAFFAFARSVLERRLAEPKVDVADVLVTGAEAARGQTPFTPSELDARVDTVGAKVDADIALAKALQVTVQPTFFINGIRLTGSVSTDIWKRIADAELAAAASTKDPSSTYAERLGANTRAGLGLPAAEARTRNPPDETIYPAVIGASPSRGPADARVTVVEFGDFEENYSRSYQDEISRLRTFYADKVRLVFKFAPQPRHDRGVLAEELAAHIYDVKGNDAFWLAHDALFTASSALDDATLERVAKEAGLDPKATLAALKSHTYAALLDADRDLVDDLKVGSLPQLFINGKRLKGVQQEAYVAAMIETEIAAADRRVASGTPAGDVYAAIMSEAKPMRAFESRAAPSVSKDNPTKGNANASITIQLFCDYASPYCNRMWTTLTELDQAHPKELRFVWRHFPLPGAANTLPAAIAGAEVRRQKGDATFWKWTEEILGSKDRDVIRREGLDRLATKYGLDVKAFDAALDAPKVPSVVEDDLARVGELGLNAVPTTFVGDFMIVGYAPRETLEHAVRAARGRKP